MKNANKYLRRITESAIMIALAFVLSCLKVRIFPQGGSVTLVSMLPMLMIGYRCGLGYGLLSGFVYGILQALEGGALKPPATGLDIYFLMMLLDYIVPFMALGLSGLFRKLPKGLILSVPVCLGIRYMSHTVSGVLLWGSYAWEGWPVWPYSLVYSATYMVPELIITLAAAIGMMRYLPEKYRTPLR